MTSALHISKIKVNRIEYVADYFPYGKILRSFSESDEERFLTTQHERDAETGLDYRGARYYDSDVARFLSLDPLAKDFAAWSPYNYVMSNPIILVDSDGKAPKPPKKVHYYNMVRQDDGSYEAVYSHSHTNIVVKSDNAEARNTVSGATSAIEQGDHGSASLTTNVYTYWNGDGTIQSQVVANKTLNASQTNDQTQTNTETDTGDYEDVKNATLIGASLFEISANMTAQEGISYSPKGVQTNAPYVNSAKTLARNAGVFGAAVSAGDKFGKTYTALEKGNMEEAGNSATTGFGYTLGGTLMCIPGGQVAGGIILGCTAIYDWWISD